jgi:hypothetical protein
MEVDEKILLYYRFSKIVDLIVQAVGMTSNDRFNCWGKAVQVRHSVVGLGIPFCGISDGGKHRSMSPQHHCVLVLVMDLLVLCKRKHGVRRQNQLGSEIQNSIRDLVSRSKLLRDGDEETGMR